MKIEISHSATGSMAGVFTQEFVEWATKLYGIHRLDKYSPIYFQDWLKLSQPVEFHLHNQHPLVDLMGEIRRLKALGLKEFKVFVVDSKTYTE